MQRQIVQTRLNRVIQEKFIALFVVGIGPKEENMLNNGYLKIVVFNVEERWIIQNRFTQIKLVQNTAPNAKNTLGNILEKDTNKKNNNHP